jgi:UDP-3-O-[3-hydroxymyristoyl] glucosamine N-acyltransferase
VRRATVAHSAAAIAELVGGRLVGDSSLEICAVGPLDGAHGDCLSFLTSKHYIDDFSRSAAGCVLVSGGLDLPAGGPPTRIVVPDAARAMSVALGALFPRVVAAASVDPTARLGRGCRLGPGAVIGPHAVLGADVEVGARTRIGAGTVLDDGVVVGADGDIGAHVTCESGTRIGDRVRIKAGAVIGGAGFGYLSGPDGHAEVPHVGGCAIGDDVSIGANSCVDRGSVGDTSIGDGCKLDNHVHVGHNSRLGKRCLVMGGSVIAGSARIGDDVVLAGHSAVGGHFRVGDRVRVAAKSGVISEVPDGTDVGGFPARPHREFLRAQAALYRLTPLIAELEALVRNRRDDD